jgi:hypothetical protein
VEHILLQVILTVILIDVDRILMMLSVLHACKRIKAGYDESFDLGNILNPSYKIEMFACLSEMPEFLLSGFESNTRVYASIHDLQFTSHLLLTSNGRFGCGECVINSLCQIIVFIVGI